MIQSREETCDWYDDLKTLEPSPVTARALPGLPDAWQDLGWWLAGLTFSSLWMLDSWSAAGPGPAGAGHLAQSFWSLLLSLGICFGIYKFSKPQSKTLAQVLCIVSALVLLLQHATRS